MEKEPAINLEQCLLLTRLPLCCQLFDVCRPHPRTGFAVRRRTEEESFLYRAEDIGLVASKRQRDCIGKKRNRIGSVVGDRALCTSLRADLRS